MGNFEIDPSFMKSVPPPCYSMLEDSDSGMEVDEVDYAELELLEDVDRDLIAEIRREGRINRAYNFRCEYTLGGSFEKKTCIWSGGTYSCPDKSSGVMWVGVHGINSVCVVTKTKDLDVTRVRGGLVYDTLERAHFNFRLAVISEIEDLADPSSKLRSKLPNKLRGIAGRSIEKPFGVVSGIPCIAEFGHEDSTDDEFERYIKNGFFPEPPGWYDAITIKSLQEKIKRDALLTSSKTVQESSVEYDDTKAIEFLRNKMKSKTAFTLNETIQTAIAAFQHLFETKFKAREIEVSFVDLEDFEITAVYKDSVQELELSEIEHHLAVINAKKKELEIKEIAEHLAGIKVLGGGCSRMPIEI